VSQRPAILSCIQPPKFRTHPHISTNHGNITPPLPNCTLRPRFVCVSYLSIVLQAHRKLDRPWSCHLIQICWTGQIKKLSILCLLASRYFSPLRSKPSSTASSQLKAIFIWSWSMFST
jgi:hypothetical protein